MEEKELKPKKRNRTNKSKGNGQGTIYYSEKLKKYVAQYVEKGTGKRKTLTQRKNEGVGEFKKRFNHIMDSMEQGTYIVKSNESLYCILKNHIEQKFLDGITSEVSHLKNQYTLEALEKSCSNFVNKPIQKITSEDIEIAKSKIREYSQSVIDKIWGLLKKGFKIAYSRRKILYNIMEDETLTKPISKKQTKVIEALNSKELKKLNKILDNQELNHKYRNIVKMQLETGMRIGETLARTVFDVNLKNHEMKIDTTLTKNLTANTILGEHTKTYNRKTNIDYGKRIIPISNEVEKIILQQKQDIKNVYGLLFWDYEKNTFINYSEINSWLRRINQKYKITDRSLSTHVLRHTKITELRKSGLDLKIIQYLVGHVEGSHITNDIYTSITPEFLAQEIKKIK